MIKGIKIKGLLYGSLHSNLGKNIIGLFVPISFCSEIFLLLQSLKYLNKKPPILRKSVAIIVDMTVLLLIQCQAFWMEWCGD
ncbi:hypothetical protein HNQ69_001216 [Bartonella callosciuri]|uniref:Uncharacterized protein n=1 Tax=Bartonella callosciuri TaxID=686223 RepID=A0A840NXN1_9HYPH|nr:hypothetical protein [Bartonella callosciuri]